MSVTQTKRDPHKYELRTYCTNRQMVSDQQKQHACRLWLQGKSHDEISKTTGVSTGTISSLIKDFKATLGQDADLIREVAVELNKKGKGKIDWAELAFSKRISNITQPLGITDDDLRILESFVGLYKKEGAPDLIKTLEAIQSTLKSPDFMRFISSNPASGSSLPSRIAAISAYIQERLAEVNGIEQKKTQIKAELARDREALKQCQAELEPVKNDLRRLDEVKKVWEKAGVSLGNSVAVANVVHNMEDLGGDPKTIMNEASTVQSLRKHRKNLLQVVSSLESRSKELTDATSKKNAELASLKTEFAFLGDGIKAAINFLEEGISVNSIVACEKIVRLADIPIESLAKAIEEYGGLKGAIEQLKARKLELENNETVTIVRKRQLLVTIYTLKEQEQGIRQRIRDQQDLSLGFYDEMKTSLLQKTTDSIQPTLKLVTSEALGVFNALDVMQDKLESKQMRMELDEKAGARKDAFLEIYHPLALIESGERQRFDLICSTVVHALDVLAEDSRTDRDLYNSIQLTKDDIKKCKIEYIKRIKAKTPVKLHKTAMTDTSNAAKSTLTA